MPQTAAFLRKLRRRYKLGEFRAKRRVKRASKRDFAEVAASRRARRRRSTPRRRRESLMGYGL